MHPKTTTAPAGHDLYTGTIALSIDRATFGNSRQASLDNVQVDADKTMLTLNKRLLRSLALRKINHVQATAVNAVYNLSVPSFFKPGICVLKFAAVPKAEAILKQAQAALAPLVETFVAEYPKAVDDMQAVLREQFRRADYPTVDEVRQMFGFKWRYLNIGAPQELETIDAKIFADQTKLVAAEMKVAAVEMRRMLLATFQEAVGHIADRLTNGVGGKPKVFRDSLLDNVSAFVENFPLRDLTNFEELQTLVTEAKSMLKGVSPTLLRDDASLRAATQKQAETLKTALDALLVSPPTRAIILDDDDVPVVSIKTAAQKAAAARKRAKVA
jgi:hypothetical protein